MLALVSLNCPQWLAVQRQDGPGDRGRAEAGVDELKARPAALAQGGLQRQVRAHGDAIVAPCCPGLVHRDRKGQHGDHRGADRDDDTGVHQLASS
jgi:hypothetical protein